MGGREAAIAVSEQDGDAVRAAVDGRDIAFAVPVEVDGRVDRRPYRVDPLVVAADHEHRIGSDLIVHGGMKRLAPAIVPAVDQYGDRVGATIRRGQVAEAIAVEIAGGYRARVCADGIVRGRAVVGPPDFVDDADPSTRGIGEGKI